MREIPLTTADIRFSYGGQSFRMVNMRRNQYTGTWTFDLHWGSKSLIGIPLSGGTNVVKGNGTPFLKLVFFDYSRTDGDIVRPDDTRLFIIEEGDRI